MKKSPQNPSGFYAYGRNAVMAAIMAKAALEVYTLERLSSDRLVQTALTNRVPVTYVTPDKLAVLANSDKNQNFVARCKKPRIYSVEELIESAKAKENGYPLLLLLDGIEDPHNLGAILRSADAFGVDGVIIKSRGEVALNSTVTKVSTGAVFFTKVATINNLSRALEMLKDAGYWSVATSDKATQDYWDVDYRSPIALLIGSEGDGLSPLLARRADFLVKIPMSGHVSCLNASVACAVVVSHIVAARR